MNEKSAGKAAVVLAWVLAMIVLTTGCATLKSDDAQPSAKAPAAARESATVYHDFSDVMVPRELKVDLKDSFVMRSAGMTSGVLVLNGSVSANSVVNFFESNMPLDGWRMTGTFRSGRSMIVFNKQTRWCVISVSEGRFRTRVEIWVAPTLDEAGTPLTR
jgi:hypothetical protein